MSSRKFNEYKGLDLPQLGREVLEVWDRENTFGRSITEREGAPAFIFYEGPPSANGLPGIHHVLSRTIKDTICRYKTQQGYLVRRKAGWDTHGLPVELGVEKKLGITKEDIGHKISIEEYNRTCREAVMTAVIVLSKVFTLFTLFTPFFDGTKRQYQCKNWGFIHAHFVLGSSTVRSRARSRREDSLRGR